MLVVVGQRNPVRRLTRIARLRVALACAAVLLVLFARTPALLSQSAERQAGEMAQRLMSPY
jgi:hypothetical protein